MKKLAIIIPTGNRSRSIDGFLDATARACQRQNIDIIIYDSSKSDKTKNIVESYQFSGIKCLKYKHYDGEYDGFSLDTKVIDAIKDFHSQYDYLWLCCDGLIITIKDCYADLMKIMEENPDYVVVDTLFRCVRTKVLEEKYQEPMEFCRKHFKRMSVLGSTIFRSDVAFDLVRKYPLDESNYSLWLTIVPFHDISRRNFLAYFYCGDVFIYNTSGTNNSFWNKGGDAIKQWVYYYTKIVSCLPSKYDTLKLELYHMDLFDFHPFRIMSLLRMRGNGGLTIGKVWQYRKQLHMVSERSLMIYFMLSCCPKWLARYVVNKQYSRWWDNIAQFYRLAFLDIEE